VVVVKVVDDAVAVVVEDVDLVVTVRVVIVRVVNVRVVVDLTDATVVVTVEGRVTTVELSELSGMPEPTESSSSSSSSPDPTIGFAEDAVVVGGSDGTGVVVEGDEEDTGTVASVVMLEAGASAVVVVFSLKGSQSPQRTLQFMESDGPNTSFWHMEALSANATHTSSVSTHSSSRIVVGTVRTVVVDVSVVGAAVVGAVAVSVEGATVVESKSHVPHNTLHCAASAAPKTPSPQTLGVDANDMQISAVSTQGGVLVVMSFPAAVVVDTVVVGVVILGVAASQESQSVGHMGLTVFMVTGLVQSSASISRHSGPSTHAASISRVVVAGAVVVGDS
jgi:hypothetical protein